MTYLILQLQPTKEGKNRVKMQFLYTFICQAFQETFNNDKVSFNGKVQYQNHETKA